MEVLRSRLDVPTPPIRAWSRGRPRRAAIQRTLLRRQAIVVAAAVSLIAGALAVAVGGQIGFLGAQRAVANASQVSPSLDIRYDAPPRRIVAYQDVLVPVQPAAAPQPARRAQPVVRRTASTTTTWQRCLNDLEYRRSHLDLCRRLRDQMQSGSH